MILFVSGATESIKRYTRNQVGVLVVPAARNRPETLQLQPGKWAMDNGAYSGFEAAAFVQMLEDFHGAPGCRFVAAPDVVADAHATLARWPFWSRVIRGVGFGPALVAQDGMTPADIPWSEVTAVFIGGSTEWKWGPIARGIIGCAKARGVWVHMGRASTRKALFEAARLGVDSFDGSAFSRWRDRMDEGVRWAADAQQQNWLPL